MQVRAATTIHLGPWRFLNLFGIEAAGDRMIARSSSTSPAVRPQQQQQRNGTNHDDIAIGFQTTITK
jgi:hypothetical protein